jgi:hypothetical protein
MKNIRIVIIDNMFLYIEGLSFLLKDLHYNIVLKTTTLKTYVTDCTIVLPAIYVR